MTVTAKRPLAELIELIDNARSAARQGREEKAIAILGDATRLADRLDRDGYLVPEPSI